MTNDQIPELSHPLLPETAQVGVATLSHRPIYPILSYRKRLFIHLEVYCRHYSLCTSADMRSRNWSRRSRYSLVGAWVGAGAVKNRIAPASKNNTIVGKYDNRIPTAKLQKKQASIRQICIICNCEKKKCSEWLSVFLTTRNGHVKLSDKFY